MKNVYKKAYFLNRYLDLIFQNSIKTNKNIELEKLNFQKIVQANVHFFIRIL